MEKNQKHKNYVLLSFMVVSVIACLSFLFISQNRFTHKYKQAIYIYMCGSTLEYNNGAATENIGEILSADISDETAVVIETGGSDGWSGYNIPSDNICRYYVKNGEIIQKEKLPNANMGDAETLKSFLEFCNNNYPAESKAVIFWNHGDAEGICYDQNYDFDKLTIPELKEAFSETSSYFDLIGFDACLMSNYDAVIGVSDYADYLLAS